MLVHQIANVQLLERFYDPISGRITLAGEPLTSYNLPSLRRCMGLISQEPVLFSDSVTYNVQVRRITAVQSTNHNNYLEL